MVTDSNFVYLDDWKTLDGYITNYSQRYPKLNNVVQSWWLQQKRNIRNRFAKDLGIMKSDVTVLMSTSPVPTNPSIENTSNSVEEIKKHFPDSDILIMADGVRTEQQHLETNYQEYVRRLLPIS